MTEEQYREILDRLTALEQDVADLKEAYQGLDSPSVALEGLKSCDCAENWTKLYDVDIPAIQATISKISLDGSTLIVTTPSAEAT